MESLVLPALANVGIRPVLPPHDERVRNTVYALLVRTPDATADGQQLLEDLGQRQTRGTRVRLCAYWVTSLISIKI